MNCNYCENRHSPVGVHYNIENVRERFIPTYAHTQIFSPLADSQIVRCTPTFHSTALNVEGYRPATNQNLKRYGQTKKVGGESSLYRNESRERRQKDLNFDRDDYYNGDNSWYDPAKQELFDSLKGCTDGYSRQRKLADLSSNPVFGGVTMEPCYINKTYQNTNITNANNFAKEEQIARQDDKKEQNKKPQAQKPAEQIKQEKGKEVPVATEEVTFGKKQKKSKKAVKVAVSTVKPTFTVVRKGRS